MDTDNSETTEKVEVKEPTEEERKKQEAEKKKQEDRLKWKNNASTHLAQLLEKWGAMWHFFLTKLVPIIVVGIIFLSLRWTFKSILGITIISCVIIIFRLNRGKWQVKVQLLCYGLLILMTTMWIISYPIAYFTNIHNERVFKNNIETLIKNTITQVKQNNYPFSIKVGKHTIIVQDEWYRDQSEYRAKYEQTNAKTGARTIIAFGLDEASSRIYELSPTIKEANKLQDHPTPTVFPIPAKWMLGFVIGALLVTHLYNFIFEDDNGG